VLGSLALGCGEGGGGGGRDESKEHRETHVGG
jgi:hypothetical protein